MGCQIYTANQENTGEHTLSASTVVSSIARVYSLVLMLHTELGEDEQRTLNSESSDCLCICTATCSSPKRTPFDNSHSSPLQQGSLTSITALRVLVSLERSPWSVKSSSRRPKIESIRDNADRPEDDDAAVRGVDGEDGEKLGNVK